MQSSTAPTRQVWKWRVWPLGLAAAMMLGAMLRLVWVKDIEYKGDEAWTFRQSSAMGRTQPFQWLGMPSSVGVPNPGMSLWVFVALSKVWHAQDPTCLARAVQVLNIAALLLLLVFAWRVVPAQERESWLWAAALGAVNPLAVLFQRKIWPPSVLPIFTLLMLLCWWRRDRRWGAFTWGLIGVCIGQIHMAGFFFAAGFFAWAWLFDRKSVAWKSWVGGSCLGALPMLPWINYLVHHFGENPCHSCKWEHVLEFRFWSRWLTEPFGIGLEYSLERDFYDFLRYPLIGGRATCLVGLLHGLIIVVALILLVRAGWSLWQQRARLGELWVGKQSPSAFTQNAAFWGFGILLSGSTLVIPRHYLVVSFPLMFVWVARLALAPFEKAGPHWGRRLLVCLCVAEFLLSASFLSYIHTNQRAIDGDYGMPYGAQGVHEGH